MKRLKVVIGVILLFGAGVLTGSFVTGIHMKNRFERFAGRGGPPTKFILKKLSSELDLSKTQKREIEIILQDSRAELSKIRKKVRPEFRSVIKKTHGRISEKLDEKQREKLDSLFHKFKKRFEQR